MWEVYVPRSVDGFELCHPECQQDFEMINTSINGTPRRGTWRAPKMKIIREDEGEVLSESDSPWLGSNALMFRRHALRELEGVLLEYGELLPINCSDADIVMFNPTRVLNALDEDASTLLRFSGGRVMRITRHAFRPEIVTGVDIFKISSLRVSPTYVSNRVIEVARRVGIRGLVFGKVWSG